MKSGPKIAFITGANRGIGLETARQLARLGIQVIGTARTREDGAMALEKLEAEGLSATYEQLDITDRDGVHALARRLLKEHGRVDILVNNAGVLLDQWRSALELDPDLIRQSMEVNFIGALNCCQAFIPSMLQREYGRVVNLSSQMGSLESMTGRLLAYRSSKTALNALTRCLADELKEVPGILINSMCPGWVRTRMGGERAPLSVEKGADTAVWLATLPPDGPTGGFFSDRKPIPF